MAKKTIQDVEVRGKRVLMRVDFNVPIEDGCVLDDRNIRAAVDSIRSVLDRGGRLILASHLGRPTGGPVEPELSLAICAHWLAGMLKQEVAFCCDSTGEQARRQVAALRDGQVLLFENLRFDSGELQSRPAFVAQLADLADVYCHEAFGTAFRDHASLVAVPRLMAATGRPCVAGLNLHRELQYLGKITADPARPLVAILGGVRMAEKIGPVLNLLDKLDLILLGGAMAYTFMFAEHKNVGDSLVEPDQVRAARRILDAAASSRAKLVLPLDHVCGKEVSPATRTRICEEVIEDGWIGLDIGPRTVVRYVEVIGSAKTIFWSGPMGVVETPPFDVGTKEIALALAHATLVGGATTITGGASTHLAIQRFSLQDNISHLSLGGAATLEMLEGKRFASVAVLEDK